MKPSSSLVSPLQTLQSTTAPQTPLARAMLPALGARTDWGAPLQSLPHSPPSRPIPSPLHSPQLRANAPSTGRLRPPTPQPFSLLCHPASPLNAVAPPSPNPSFLPPPPLRSLPSPDLLPPPAHLRRSPPPTWFWGVQELEGGDQSPGVAASLAGGRAGASGVGCLAPLSLPAASRPAPPRCRSEEDAPRVRAAAPAAASLQHRLTAASAPVPAPQTRALDHAALTDEQHSQCKGTEAASPAAPQAHLPPPRRTQASEPQGFLVLPLLSRSLALVPGAPTRQIPNLAPMPFPGTQAP